MVCDIRWLIGFQGASADKAEANWNWNDDLAWIREVPGPAGWRAGRGRLPVSESAKYCVSSRN